MSAQVFSIVPHGWMLTTIGDVCEPPQYGYTTKAAPKGDLYLLRTTDITKGEINWKTVPFCSKNPSDIDKYLLQDGDVVISRAGSVGVSYLVTNPPQAVYASYLIRFRPKINTKFFKYYLESPFYWEQITENKLGIAVPNVNASKLRGITLLVPSEEEQENIVAKVEELFSELDSGIASLKTAQQQLGIYRQSLLKHAFEGKLTEQWRKDNADKLETPEQLLARIQQEREARYQQQLEAWQQAVKAWEAKGKEGRRPTKPRKQVAKHLDISEKETSELPELPELPDAYVYTYLSNVGDLERGKSKHRPRNDPQLFGGKYPFIQTGEVKAAGHKITSFTQTYSEFGFEQSKLWPKGTLCITIAANIAETAFLGFEACFPDSIVGFTAYDIVLPEYVGFFIKAVRIKIEAYAPATAQKNINLRTLEGLIIPYCSLAEQQEIVSQLENKLSLIEQNEIEIKTALIKAELLRQSILKKAFSGKFSSKSLQDINMYGFASNSEVRQ